MTGALFLGMLVPLVFLILFIKGENRVLLLFLIWGLTAVLPASFLNQWVQDALSVEQLDLAVFIVPLIEEFLKALPLFLILFNIKYIKGNFILFIAMAAGIGFSIHENFMYLIAFGTVDFMVITVSIVRSLSTALMHGITVVITGYAFLASKQAGKFFISMLAGCFICAVIVHGLYNYLVTVQSLAGFGFIIPISLFLFLFLGITRTGKKRKAVFW